MKKCHAHLEIAVCFYKWLAILGRGIKISSQTCAAPPTDSPQASAYSGMAKSVLQSTQPNDVWPLQLLRQARITISKREACCIKP